MSDRIARASQGGGTSGFPPEPGPKRRKGKPKAAIGRDAAPPEPLPLEAVPPQSIEAEMCLLGCMVLDPQVIGDVVQLVDREACFYVPQHRMLFNVLVEMSQANQAVDLLLLRAELERRGILDALGGVETLVRLVESVPDTGNAPGYAKLVKEKSLLRDLIQVAGQIQHEAYTSPRAAELILDEAEKAMFEITHRREVGQIEQISALVDEQFRIIEQADGSSITGVETGFTQLDGMLGGLQRGEMIVIAARPSMGKTAFALNLAEHIAVDRKTPVAVFSMEMSKSSVCMRVLCSRAGVDSSNLRKGTLSAEEIQKLQMVAQDLRAAPMYIDDSVALTPLAIRARCRRLAQRHEIQAVVIDYLQLMREPTAESRQVEITLISSGIKQIARELDVPVVALAQLNRGVEGREGHKPRMSDLRESGSIEQDADVVMLLHREEYYQRENELVKGKAQIIVAKQRNGPVGDVELQFNPILTRFRNLYST